MGGANALRPAVPGHMLWVAGSGVGWGGVGGRGTRQAAIRQRPASVRLRLLACAKRSQGQRWRPPAALEAGAAGDCSALCKRWVYGGDRGAKPRRGAVRHWHARPPHPPAAAVGCRGVCWHVLACWHRPPSRRLHPSPVAQQLVEPAGDCGASQPCKRCGKRRCRPNAPGGSGMRRHLRRDLTPCGKRTSCSASHKCAIMIAAASAVRHDAPCVIAGAT